MSNPRMNAMTMRQYLLIVLMEEAAEVQQRASKALRFSLEEVQPAQSLTNLERLREEVTDLWAVLSLLRDEGVDLSPYDVAPKRSKVLQYSFLSRAMGVLEEHGDGLGEDLTRLAALPTCGDCPIGNRDPDHEDHRPSEGPCPRAAWCDREAEMQTYGPDWGEEKP